MAARQKVLVEKVYGKGKDSSIQILPPTPLGNETVEI